MNRSTVIAEGIFSGAFAHAPDGPEDDQPVGACKKEGESHEQDHRDIEREQIALFFTDNDGHGGMDGNIPAHMIIM